MSDRITYPQTEPGLAEALTHLEVARAQGDDDWTGSILLQLSQLVKWVRSDNDEPPFQRADTLALEALESFRKSGNVKGQVAALIAAISMFQPEVVQERLDEAARLAAALQDRLLIAQVTAARARNIAMRDREESKRLTLEALDEFRELDHKGGMARCLFGLAIGPGKDQEKVDYALEASDLYRQVGNRGECGRTLSLALMNSETPDQIAALEPHFQQLLQESQTDGDRGNERTAYNYFARLSALQGDHEAAEKYARWASELDPDSSLTPEEKLARDISMTEMLLEGCRAAGNKEGEKSFKSRLKDLRQDLKRLQSAATT